jgi:4-alpha-glucanotransferase
MTKYFSHFLDSPAARQWKKIEAKPHHGIAIPLFSLHTNQSYGIGEFTDLLPLIDWCTSIGFDVIQLLPLNDTGFGTSPYSALSAFALNPIYIGLKQLPYLDEFPILQDELQELSQFSNASRVHYVKVREQKERFLRHYYEIVEDKILMSSSYQQFVEQANFWLPGYAVFKIVKNWYKGKEWERWTEHNPPSSEFLENIQRATPKEFNWHCCLQFLCDLQLKAAKNYADAKKVFLMGDVPILIDRDSADVWIHREIFDLRYSAGAPPDMFSENGQNWGFPIYNWTHLAHQDYRWWIERLRWAERYYHTYRIDHIVGFFRIWAIPLGKEAKDGFFFPHSEEVWIDQGQKIMLMMLNNCEMLPIGEDLGVVPPSVRICLSALGICGTRVMRWERKWKEENQLFIALHEYLIETMTTVSTHDSETIQQWWHLNASEAQLFAKSKGWSYDPILNNEYHQAILKDSHHTASLFHINLLPEYLALVPGLTWPHLDDERINIPGILDDRNWSYRLKPSLEEIMQNKTLSSIMKDMLID